MIKCKNEYQEKKIKFIASIFANVLFDDTISSDNANQILITAERFSYRKLCLLSLIGNKSVMNKFQLRTARYRDNSNFVDSVDLDLVLQDYFELSNSGLIASSESAMAFPCDVTPGLVFLTPMGKKYFDLMSLNEIVEEEFYDFIPLLK